VKVALVHDWLNGMRGGEKCLECFCEIFPEADLFTLVHTKGKCSPIIENRRIITSFMNNIPGKDKYYRHMLPIMPVAIERFILKDYDLILSSSHCAAKGVIPGPDTHHISYVHSPMRYVWDMYEEYFGKGKAGKAARLIIPFFATYLRMWDVASSARVDHFIANSVHVAKRIKKYYRRESEVIHPPVDLDKFKISNDIDDYYLMLTAFAPYKRVDLAIEAFNKLGYKLKIVGNGQDERKLKDMASSNIEFLGWQPDESISQLYSRCKAFIFPGEEDFGITPLEAMASGRPVIAYARGGALETVCGIDGKNPTGIFFYEQTSESLISALKAYEINAVLFDPLSIKEHAKGWSKERFINDFKVLINKHMN
jgi:glycosyltransferase involved in cell wall biosynthesis